MRLRPDGRVDISTGTTNKPAHLVIGDPAEAVLLLLYGEAAAYEVDARWPVAATVVRVIEELQAARETHAANMEREARRNADK